MLKKLKQIIQDANPELKKLKVGSYVTGMGYSYSRVVMFCQDKILLNKGDYLIAKEKLEDVEKECSWENEITLADLIIAMKENIQKHLFRIHYNIPFKLGKLCFYAETLNPCETLSIKWDLEKDLDGQTKETQEFLYKLLK